MCHMMDSQRSHCQQIMSSSVCCTCIPVTKWCHWCTGELSRGVRVTLALLPSLGDTGTKPWTACFDQAREAGRVRPLLCWGPFAFPGGVTHWEAPGPLQGAVVPFPAVPIPQEPGMGSFPCPLLLPACSWLPLLITGVRGGAILVWEKKNHLILQQNWKVCVRNLSNTGNLHY